MNKDLSMMTIIRLQTELEDAIEKRNYYAQSSENLIMFTLWDETVDLIIEEIRQLGK